MNFLQINVCSWTSSTLRPRTVSEAKSHCCVRPYSVLVQVGSGGPLVALGF